MNEQLNLGLVTEVLTEEELNKLPKLILVNLEEPGLKIRLTEDKRVYVSSVENLSDSYHENDKIDWEDKLQLLEKRMRHYFPQITTKVDYVWYGKELHSEDQFPFIGASQDIPNAFFVYPIGKNPINYSLLAMDMFVAFVNGKTHQFNNVFSLDR